MTSLSRRLAGRDRWLAPPAVGPYTRSHMRSFVAWLALFVLSAPAVAGAQGAGALASPWGPGHDEGEHRGAPIDDAPAAEPPQDIHAEGAAALGPGGVVVPDGYSTDVVPSPGVYPSATPHVDGPTLSLPGGIVTRLRALDTDFAILAARGGGSVLDGILALAFGALSIGVGIAFEPSVSGLRGTGSISPYLYTYGSGMVVRGVLDLAFLTNPSASALTYANMPMRTYRDVRDRLHYGEDELGHLAEMASISRYLGGSLNIALGLLVIPVYLAPNGFHEEDAGAYIMLLGAAVSVTTGLITLFSTSEAERRWGAYQELRNRLAATVAGDDDAELDEAVEAEGSASLHDGLTVNGSIGIGSFVVDGRF